MPPSRIQWITCTPTGDGPSISLSCVIFILERGTIWLGVKRWEGANVTLPTETISALPEHQGVVEVTRTYEHQVYQRSAIPIESEILKQKVWNHILQNQPRTHENQS